MSAAGPLTADRPASVAVVIPAKDEAERIEATVRAARGVDRVDLVVVVDDGSSDATAAVASGAGALVVRHHTNRGKAAAMATGARVVAMREDAEAADGGADFREELHAEPRMPGHTGPLPVISPADPVSRALLFLDGDMQDSALNAAPLVDAVLDDGVDMAIALLPPQDGAAGFGIVVRTARSGIRRVTGWEPQQPLSGTRCITREVWEACQPLAPGWGVETSLTIDALTGGFWVKEVPCELRHRATGKDFSGQLHRAAQLRDVTRALLRRRTVRPPEIDEDEHPVEVVERPEAAESTAPTVSTAAATETGGTSEEAGGAEQVEQVDATAGFSYEQLSERRQFPGASAVPDAPAAPAQAEAPEQTAEREDPAEPEAPDGIDEPAEADGPAGADALEQADGAEQGDETVAVEFAPEHSPEPEPEPAVEPEPELAAEPETADEPAAEPAPPAYERPRPTRAAPTYASDDVDAWGTSPSDAAPSAQAPGAEPTEPEPVEASAPAPAAVGLEDLPAAGDFDADLARELREVDLAALDSDLRALPVDAPFEPEDIVLLAGADLHELARRMHEAPVDGVFAPDHAVIMAAHLGRGVPEVPERIAVPMDPGEYTSFVVQAAVEAADAEGQRRRGDEV